MELAIWFENGAVAYFKEVSGFEERRSEIVFSYYGVSTNTYKIARFYLNKISGWAITE